MLVQRPYSRSENAKFSTFIISNNRSLINHPKQLGKYIPFSWISSKNLQSIEIVQHESWELLTFIFLNEFIHYIDMFSVTWNFLELSYLVKLQI